MSVSNGNDTLVSGDVAVENDRHHHHEHHDRLDQSDQRDGGDGRDGDSPLLTLEADALQADPASAIDPDQDPIGFIEAAIVRLKDDVGVLAEDGVIHAFSILHATDMPAFLRLRHLVKVTNRDCSVTVLDKLVRQTLPSGSDDPVGDRRTGGSGPGAL